MKLISMTDFVLEKQSLLTSASNSKKHLYEIYAYANFLKQPHQLWMFVPCDENGNVLEEPDHSMYFTATTIGEDKYYNDVHEYEQAKERVLFDGLSLVETRPNFFLLDVDGDVKWIQIDETIEDLIKHNLTLSKTAIKQLGL